MNEICFKTCPNYQHAQFLVDHADRMSGLMKPGLDENMSMRERLESSRQDGNYDTGSLDDVERRADQELTYIDTTLTEAEQAAARSRQFMAAVRSCGGTNRVGILKLRRSCAAPITAQAILLGETDADS